MAGLVVNGPTNDTTAPRAFEAAGGRQRLPLLEFAGAAIVSRRWMEGPTW